MKSGFVLQPKMPDREAGAIVHSPRRPGCCSGNALAAERSLRAANAPECRNKRLQTKLAMNQPGDRFEHEADRMADFRDSRPEASARAFRLLVRRVAA